MTGQVPSANAIAMEAVCFAALVVVAGCASPAPVPSPTQKASFLPAPTALPATGLPGPTRSPVPSPPPSPATSRPRIPSLPTVVEEGDAVFAYGSLFETETPSHALLCAWAGGWPPDVGCIGMGRTVPVVTVSNVNVRALRGTEANPHVPDLPRDTWVTFHVRVEGDWVNGALDVAEVEGAASPSMLHAFPMPEPPCDPPAGGWPGEGHNALLGLASVVGRNSEKYAGITSAVLTDADGRPTDYVAVVGTIDEPDALAPMLHSRYPYSLCVLRPDRSTAELQEVASELRKLKRGWDIWIDAAIGRVAVVVPVFDQATADAIRPYADSVSVRPIVRVR